MSGSFSCVMDERSPAILPATRRAWRCASRSPSVGRLVAPGARGCLAVVSNRGQVADRGGDEALLVLVARAVARRVEGARGAVEIAPQQEHRGDAQRGAVRGRIGLERAGE